jgi:DNA-binding transcriptional MerR regulator
MPRTDSPAVLPPIPAKRYFTIGEVSELTLVKPHVLRYWEQEFTQLKPLKRRGNRRYYQHHEVLLIRRIRELLYEHGFTISGARNRLDHDDSKPAAPNGHAANNALIFRKMGTELPAVSAHDASAHDAGLKPSRANGEDVRHEGIAPDLQGLRAELLELQALLK